MQTATSSSALGRSMLVELDGCGSCSCLAVSPAVLPVAGRVASIYPHKLRLTLSCLLSTLSSPRRPPLLRAAARAPPLRQARPLQARPQVRQRARRPNPQPRPRAPNRQPRPQAQHPPRRKYD
ncbi:hypothetical protein L1887_55290 [Cichorium endivia]|nr:hypothetical protein L1887_55290 [Cichorium endivia]